MSVQPTSEKRTVLQLSGSAAIAIPPTSTAPASPIRAVLIMRASFSCHFGFSVDATRLASARQYRARRVAALPGAPVRRLPDRHLGRRRGRSTQDQVGGLLRYHDG